MSQNNLRSAPDRGPTPPGEGAPLTERLAAVERCLIQIETTLDRLLKRVAEPRPPSPLLKVEQIAKYLGISEREVWDLFAEGAITPLRLTSRITRVHRESVEAYLRSRSVGTMRGEKR